MVSMRTRLVNASALRRRARGRVAAGDHLDAALRTPVYHAANGKTSQQARRTPHPVRACPAFR